MWKCDCHGKGPADTCGADDDAQRSSCAQILLFPQSHYNRWRRTIYFHLGLIEQIYIWADGLLMLGQAKGGTMKQTIGAANPLWGPILTSSSTLNYSSSSHAREGNKVLTLSSSSFAYSLPALHARLFSYFARLFSFHQFVIPFFFFRLFFRLFLFLGKRQEFFFFGPVAAAVVVMQFLPSSFHVKLLGSLSSVSS